VTDIQRRKQIEVRLELHRRINHAREPRSAAYGSPADTRTLFNEAREVLARLLALADRDVDSAVGS